jgi:cardiolipin hydrolase
VNSIKFLFCRRLIQLVEEATSSLDICMFFITCQDLSEAVIRVHRRGVNVRVIADADMADGECTRVPQLRKCGKEQL